MALISSLEPNTKVRQSVHRPTRCLFAIVDGPEGERYLQLDTVGSENREIPDKVSQSIQFDRQAASQLLQLLHRTFPGLADSDSSSQTNTESTTDAEEEAVEGRMLFKLHRLRERNPELVQQKKQTVISDTGHLSCEVCDFEFAVVYGSIGNGFAECHHRTPLGQLNGMTVTKLSDLAIVCANCHRMLHRGSGHSVEQLRTIVHERRIATL